MHKLLGAILIAFVALLWLDAQGQAGEGETNYATAKNDVDIYNSPVEPRIVIGILRAGTGTSVLAYHRDGWCKLSLKGFIG